MASIISLIGPPGSGKGTYGAILAARILDASFVGVGDILREHSATNDKLASILRSGALVDDEIANDAVIQHLEGRAFANKLIVLDGYPRTSAQASLLSKWPVGLRPSLAIQFDVPDHVW